MISKRRHYVLIWYNWRKKSFISTIGFGLLLFVFGISEHMSSWVWETGLLVGFAVIVLPWVLFNPRRH